MSTYLPYLAPLLVFGLVVFVHELGHFLAAKVLGVYAPRFSIGFGPALWSHRWGETEYRLAALPLGGYVRMASRDDEAAAIEDAGTERDTARKDWDPNAMMPFGPRPIPPNRWFESKSLAARVTIMLSGVAMNVVLAFVILAAVNLYWGAPTVSSAPVIAEVVPGTPAATAGLEPGDSISAVAGQPVSTWTDLVGHITASAGQQLPLTVWRHGTSRSMVVVPRATPDTNPDTHAVRTVGKIGAARRLDRNPMRFGRALTDAASSTWRMAGFIVSSLHVLVTQRGAWRGLVGPVGIAKVSVDAARIGLVILLDLIALISVNLAVINLLPIPILDGGQVLVNVIEAIKGSPLSLQTREYILRVGLIAIVLLFAVVMYNDRCRIFSALCSQH